MAQALEHGKEVQRRRQEEFEKGKQDLLQWRAEEEDRENLRKARRVSLEQPAVLPTAGGVVLTPAPKAMSGTDGDGGGESRYAARSASSAIVRGRDCVPQATAGASVQVFGQEGGREVGRDVRSVQVPPKKGVEPPIRARAHFSNPAFDVVRKKEIVCTVESELEFEFEYPIKLRGNRLAKHILQSHTPYDPSCAVCLMSKGLKRAPKRTDQVTNEIPMDIANLCTHPKSPNMYRYVVMWNRTHGMIATAAIYVDQASTIRVLTAAINHCSSTGAMVLSDEGRDLTALISELIRLKVVSRHETSRPGRHATGAERAVRTLKTQLGCIRTVLYQHGLMLGSESLRYAAANACHVHNAFQLCRNRYKKYLEEEYKRIVPIEDESSVPVVPEGLEEGLDTEGKPESQQESGERVPESESEREKRKRKSIDDEWDRFHREHEEKETGERFPEFDDVPFHAPKGQEADTEPTPMQEDPTNPYEIGKNPEPIEDDRMSEGYEPTEVPEGYRAPESPGRVPWTLICSRKSQKEGRTEIMTIGKLTLTSLC